MYRHIGVTALLGMVLVIAAPLAMSWGDARSDGEGSTSRPESAASQPATRKAPTTTQALSTEDPLRSPRSMVNEFLRAVEDSRTKPERIKDAVACLDLSEFPPGDAAEQGPKLAEQVEYVFEQIAKEQALTIESIPDAPGEDVYRFGDEQLFFVLGRRSDGRWCFTAETVAAVPEMDAALRKATTTQSAAAVAPDVPAEHRTPRATMATFLEAVNDNKLDVAAACLDLSELPEASRQAAGENLAVKLKGAMDRIALVQLKLISDDPVKEIGPWHIGADGRIELTRMESGEWLFNRVTVANIEALFEAKQETEIVEGVEGIAFWTSPGMWLRSRIPPELKDKAIGFEYWQWIGIALTVLMGWIVSRLFNRILGFFLSRRLQAEYLVVARKQQQSAIRPLGMLAMVLTWWFGIQLLEFKIATLVLIWPAIRFVATVVGVWAAYRFVDLVAAYSSAQARRTSSRLDEVLVPLIRKLLKIVIVAIGLIFIFKSIGVGDTTLNKLFAGVGLGGLAFALAAQDTIRNFFGSVTVILDRPFQVGDWVKIANVEGTVESVGLRSSRIRTFYNSQVTVPNSDLISATVDNLGRRQYRRISCKLAVTYSTTPEQLEAFCSGICELIRLHPYTRTDFYQVWVNEFADSSINVLLYCFHEVPDWSTELRERHRLFLDIIRLAKRLNVEFAFPTQTIHVASGQLPAVSQDAGAAETTKSDSFGESDPATFGKDEAKRIIRETMGDAPERPPPFEFPSVEKRGP